MIVPEDALEVISLINPRTLSTENRKISAMNVVILKTNKLWFSTAQRLQRYQRVKV